MNSYQKRKSKKTQYNQFASSDKAASNLEETLKESAFSNISQGQLKALGSKRTVNDENKEEKLSFEEMNYSLGSPFKKKKEMENTPENMIDPSQNLKGSATTLNSSQSDLSNYSLECYESLKDPDYILPTNIQEYPEEDLTQPIDSTTLNYLIEKERKLAPDPYYFAKFYPEVTCMMRTILLDWVMEVSMEFRLKRETYHLSLSYVDRFLSRVSKIEKKELQLLGVCALWVASKMEEVCPPKLIDFAKATDNCYTVSEIKKMELNLYSVNFFFLNLCRCLIGLWQHQL